MCELLALSSNHPATVSFSLMQFAPHGGFSGPHKDGWGIGYYQDRDVLLIKEAEAAADSDWVRFIQEHDLRSPLIVAHIRRATRGPKTFANAQPFTRELAGRQHLFAHNGCLGGIFDAAAFQPNRFHPVGDTDSEVAFCALMERMQVIWRDPSEPPSIEQRLAVVESFAAELREQGVANFFYADGDALFAHGHRRTQASSNRVEPPGLVLLQRRCRHGQPGFAADGLTVEGGDQWITLLASVPLTNEPWDPLAEGELVVITKGRVLARQSPGADPVWTRQETPSFAVAKVIP